MEIREARPDEYVEAGNVLARAYAEFADSGDPGWREHVELVRDVAGRVDRTVVLVAMEEGRILGSATIELRGVVGDDYAPCAKNGADCTDVFAVSLPGEMPSAHITWFQAQQACKNSRKRLLTSAEWQAATAGTPDPGPDDGMRDCNTASSGIVAQAGSREDCVSAAGAFDIEGGMRFAKWSARAGWYRSSGDGNASDGDHETFFQILPTPRIYARFPFYNAMNSDDAFVQITAKPHAKVSLRSELHRLKLADENDLWYVGGGAFDDKVFGFTARPSSRKSDLATVLDLSADITVNATTTLTLYAGRVAGGEIVRSIFDGDDALFAYVEVVKKF